MSKTIKIDGDLALHTLAEKGVISDVFLVVTTENEKSVREAETVEIHCNGKDPVKRKLASYSVVGQGYHPRGYPGGWTVRYPSFRLHLAALEEETPAPAKSSKKEEKQSS